MEQTTEIRCPKCGSNQITANKKGFSGGKALVGGILTGGVGLLAGTIGSKKIIITCLSCGNEFKPGDSNKPISKISKPSFKEKVDAQYEIKQNNKPKSEKKLKTKKTWQITLIIMIVLAVWFFIGVVKFTITNNWNFLIFYVIIDALFIFGAVNANKRIKEFEDIDDNMKIE